MSRKRKAPKKIPVVDPKFKSAIIPKLINSIMYDGKKTIAEKIIYILINFEIFLAEVLANQVRRTYTMTKIISVIKKIFIY